MVFPTDILFHGALIVLGVFGFWVAKHISNHKTKNAPLVCMVGFDCHTVVHSDYSKFFGVRVEVLGMMYYAFVACVHLFVLVAPDVFLFNLYFLSVAALLSLLSIAAFVFSLYLIAIQIFVLKKGCSWCIVSAFISLAIFLLLFFL